MSECPPCSVSHRSILFNFHNLQGYNYYYFCIEDTEAQKHSMTYLKPGNQYVAEPEAESRTQIKTEQTEAEVKYRRCP